MKLRDLYDVLGPMEGILDELLLIYEGKFPEASEGGTTGEEQAYQDFWRRRNKDLDASFESIIGSDDD